MELLDAEADRLYARPAATSAVRIRWTPGKLRLHTNKAGEVRNASILVAIGVNQEGYGEVLAA